MVNINEVFGKWDRDAKVIADLAKIPSGAREEFFAKLTAWLDAGTGQDAVDIINTWNALSDGDRRALETLRKKLIAANNAARALTPPQALCILCAGHSHEWFSELERLTVVLANATLGRYVPPARYVHPGAAVTKRGRPKGSVKGRRPARDLLEVVESCGGRLPSKDDDPNGVTINKIIRILQPHFPKGTLRPISPSTFRRGQKDRRVGWKENEAEEYRGLLLGFRR
jgi:hypothetical protein